MAYNLGDRFPPPPKCIQLLDPGAYNIETRGKLKSNKVPFLSSAPRKTLCGVKLWTDNIYNTNIPQHIQNCTSFKSKTPRFPYEAFSAEDLEEILCRCGLENPCECAVGEEQEDEVVCQAKVRRHLYKGPPPHSLLGEGISAPSKRHLGFEILPDGCTKQILKESPVECPPFYDARVNEATAFYRGWKWSKWKSNRAVKSLEVRPGPADYTIERQPTEWEICAEQVRANRRKTSKQLRYIEIIQNRNILEGRPGPADYDPKGPKGTELETLGPKTDRFPTSKYEFRPGPADYWVKRDFEPPESLQCLCHIAKLPEPACFGVKAPRFKPARIEGPGPAEYYPKSKLCQFLRCPTAPFNTSAPRFKEKMVTIGPEDSDENSLFDETEQNDAERVCPPLTWEFKSKTKRSKPLIKKWDEPSPADILLSKRKVERQPILQYTAPFNSSEGRFQPWYDWMSVYGILNTPGPGYYNLEKPRCLPAVHSGPIHRAPRFPDTRYLTPAPNEYKVGGGIETVLATHNNGLKRNMKNQHKFRWKQPHEPRKLSYEQRETLLLNKIISLLDTSELKDTTNEKPADVAMVDVKQKPVEVVDPNLSVPPQTTGHLQSCEPQKSDKKQKLLHSFLYRKPMPHYF